MTVTGLDPDTTYYYGFFWRDTRSVVGRTRTLPGPDSARVVRLAVLCCQHYEDGWFTAYRHLRAEDPDLAVHLGDYVYARAGGSPAPVRRQPVVDPGDVTGYRALWEAARRDTDLAAAHATMPFAVIWDDNEFSSNHAGPFTGDRAGAALQAWWEHQPLDVAPPTADGLVVHRRIDLGGAGRLWLLDARQHRSPQVCERLDLLGAVEECADVDDDSRTMLGADQEAWLAGSLDPAAPGWDLVAQPVVMADLAIRVGGLAGINNDQWDGYRPARRRVLAALDGHPRAAILSGDLHAAMANTVGGTGDTGGTGHAELVAPSVTSPMSSSLATALDLALRRVDHVEYFEPRRHGYLLVDVGPDRLDARFRYVDPTTPDAPPTDGPAFAVSAGSSRPERL